MQETLQAHQQDFMQEDAQAGMLYAFLEDYTGDRVCSKQLYADALGNTNIPAAVSYTHLAMIWKLRFTDEKTEWTEKLII